MNTSSVAIKNKKTNYVVEEDGFETQSPLMQDIFKKVEGIAKLEQHVILVGEIGVGKKRLAHIIHNHSARALAPFYSFYCVDVNETEFQEAFWEHIQFEDEHMSLKYDVLEKAENGILFLDQFSELSGPFMINVIDSYLRGCKQLFRYNTTVAPRLIISVSQDAFKQLNKTKSWAMLLNKIDPISITVPPLRERKEDIPGLIEKFLKEITSHQQNWSGLNMTLEAVKACQAYSWPGNVRQLKNAIIQSAVGAKGALIDVRHLPFSMHWKLSHDL